MRSRSPWQCQWWNFRWRRFVLESLALKELNSNQNLLLTTIHGTQQIDTKAINGLMASYFQENVDNLPLPRTYVRQRITDHRDEILQPERLQEWSHLQRICKHIPPYMDDVEIGLLIGLNYLSTVLPRDIICRNENCYCSLRSLLGRHVNGPASHKSSKEVHCNRIQILKSSTDDEVNRYVVAERRIK